MPFDGDYRSVSAEVSDSGSNEHRCNARALAPPRPLTITNGVVGIPGYWEGTVSSQGAVVIRNPRFSRVDGQIDRQGTIRGQYSGELPPDVLAQIDGGGTNCIIKSSGKRNDSERRFLSVEPLSSSGPRPVRFDDTGVAGIAGGIGCENWAATR